ncbi:unnamed protein product [Candidula unifasciata]|uniref:MARVEL domain-containing protein n=1 Tax=Candidula unifasciata TaxID=100452 RepID=A0A8S4A1J8_9EUPU|nr:unnamed protein product [Candidula unifasciata]
MAVLDMLTENLVVRLRLVVYCILVFFSFFIFVGIGVFKDNHLGLCLLYYSGYAAPVSNCNYPMAIAIIFQLIYALARIVLLALLMLGKLTTEMFVFSNILELVYVLLDVIACILTFIGACILSAGFTGSSQYFWGSSKTSVDIAQAGAWIGTILWIILSVVGVVYILRAGKLSFTKSGGTSGGAGTSSPSAPPQEIPPNYDQSSKY